MADKPNFRDYPFKHLFAQGKWKEDMYCEEVQENEHYQMTVDFLGTDGSVVVHGKDSDVVINTAKALSAFPEMIQLLEMFHDRYKGKPENATSFELIKQTLEKAGIL